MKEMINIYLKKVYSFCSNILIILLLLSLILYNKNIALILLTIFSIEFVLILYLIVPILLVKKRVKKQEFMYNCNFNNDFINYIDKRDKPLFIIKNWVVVCTLSNFHIIHIDSLKYLRRKKRGINNKIILKDKKNKTYNIYILGK